MTEASNSNEGITAHSGCGVAIGNAMLCVSLFLPWLELSRGRTLLGTDFLPLLSGGAPQGPLTSLPVVVLVVATLVVSVLVDVLRRLRRWVKTIIQLLQLASVVALSTMSAAYSWFHGQESGGGLLLAIISCAVGATVWSLRAVDPGPIASGSGEPAAPRGNRRRSVDSVEAGDWRPQPQDDQWRHPSGSDHNGAVV